MSAMAVRPVPDNSPSTAAARSGSRFMTTAAPSDNATMTVSECATTSCISRAIRLRSPADASSAFRAAHSRRTLSCSRSRRTVTPTPTATARNITMKPLRSQITPGASPKVLTGMRNRALTDRTVATAAATSACRNG